GRRPWSRSRRAGCSRSGSRVLSATGGSECSRSKASHLRFGPPEIEIWKVSLTPGSPSSVTSTVKVRGRPSLIHVPPKVAVAPAIESQFLRPGQAAPGASGNRLTPRLSALYVGGQVARLGRAETPGRSAGASENGR